MNTSAPFIVGLGGTPRLGSTSEQALQLALSCASAEGAETEIFTGGDLLLPMYRPDGEDETGLSARLISSLRRADGVIISSPVYHGSVSGLIKNAIDYIEELRADRRVYLDQRSVGLISCGFGNQGPAMVLGHLREMTHALRGWPTPLGVSVNTADVRFENGACSSSNVSAQIEIMARQVVSFATRGLALDAA